MERERLGLGPDSDDEFGVATGAPAGFVVALFVISSLLPLPCSLPSHAQAPASPQQAAARASGARSGRPSGGCPSTPPRECGRTAATSVGGARGFDLSDLSASCDLGVEGGRGRHPVFTSSPRPPTH
jgi:hypothetical protein